MRRYSPDPGTGRLRVLSNEGSGEAGVTARIANAGLEIEV